MKYSPPGASSAVPAPKIRPEEENLGAAFLWMLLSGLSFSAMAVAIKWVSSPLGEARVPIPIVQVVFFRSVILFAVAYLRGRSRSEDFLPANWRLLVFRGVSGFLSLVCYVYSLARLPLSIATTLAWCSPLFVLGFSRVFLQEKVRRRTLVWIPVALLGLFLLVSPKWIQGDAMTSEGAPWQVYGIALLGTALVGVTYTSVRAATGRAGVNTIIMYFGGISSLLSFPFMAISFVLPSNLQWLGLLAVGGTASVAQVAMTQGYRSARAGLVSLMGLMSGAFAALWGVVLFGETLDPWQGLGILLLALGVGAITLSNRQSR